MRTLSNRAAKKAEQEAEAFHRRIHCQVCDLPKESFQSKGETTYYCPTCNSLATHCATVGKYWRRSGEQEQN